MKLREVSIWKGKEEEGLVSELAEGEMHEKQDDLPGIIPEKLKIWVTRKEERQLEGWKQEQSDSNFPPLVKSGTTHSLAP